ncbi:uncharacterized protein LOC131644997 [Vicia villosa]|uniref:uncharacterized protein LOC131644997 n=1 Tax=Vicia villosa TaxID=3911 RepID=UPI00273A7FB6|nr:uncharacterized protein LOC131644997 [Vicia villosa]
MSVMVNGSPTKEFGVKKGLRQGNPLSPFLFVLVAEALARLVRKSSEIGEFENFEINRRCGVDILQFADDTLLVGKGSWKHVKALKIVLRSFELVSGLGINFHKSKLIGINVSPLFLDAAAYYLSCKIESSNFLFLGIPIGSNPRKEATWSPLMPTKVAKVVTTIQSNFLWGGEEEKKKIHWVGWKGVTRPQEKGGLGIKNIGDFNLALLNKWRWRIAQGNKSMWLEVSVAVMGGWLEGVWKWGDLGISVVGRDADFFFSFGVEGSFREFRRIPFGPPAKGDVAFNLIWKADIPFKIKAFGWRLFLNRLPTKDVLMYRGINLNHANSMCIFCNSHVEEADHLFSKCFVIKLVWKEIAMWVGFLGWSEEECIPFFLEWHSLSRVNKVKSGKLGVFWLATTWIIWLTRNAFCFRNEVWNINNMVWSIKFLAWRWSTFGNITYSNCSFYDFYKDPWSYLK